MVVERPAGRRTWRGSAPIAEFAAGADATPPTDRSVRRSRIAERRRVRDPADNGRSSIRPRVRRANARGRRDRRVDGETDCEPCAPSRDGGTPSNYDRERSDTTANVYGNVGSCDGRQRRSNGRGRRRQSARRTRAPSEFRQERRGLREPRGPDQPGRLTTGARRSGKRRHQQQSGRGRDSGLAKRGTCRGQGGHRAIGQHLQRDHAGEKSQQHRRRGGGLPGDAVAHSERRTDHRGRRRRRVPAGHGVDLRGRIDLPRGGDGERHDPRDGHHRAARLVRWRRRQLRGPGQLDGTRRRRVRRTEPDRRRHPVRDRLRAG